MPTIFELFTRIRPPERDYFLPEILVNVPDDLCGKELPGRIGRHAPWRNTKTNEGFQEGGGVEGDANIAALGKVKRLSKLSVSIPSRSATKRYAHLNGTPTHPLTRLLPLPADVGRSYVILIDPSAAVFSSWIVRTRDDVSRRYIV